MGEKSFDIAAVGGVELAVRRLDCLSILPSVAAHFLSAVLRSGTSGSALAEIVECDPVLAAGMFSARRRGGGLRGNTGSIRQLAGELSPEEICAVFLSLKVFGDEAGPAREQLVRHSLAVACCAAEIAQAISDRVDRQLAYAAGLLHDIGKLALQEVMPKSFARILEEAKTEQVGSCIVEQMHLGVDHAILGKRLAQKWGLPPDVTTAIWLHHSDIEVTVESMPEARIAQVVRLADCMAHRAVIGDSGSHGTYDSPERIGRSLGIGGEQLESIFGNLAGQVKEKEKTLGLGIPEPQAKYREALGKAAAQWGAERSTLSAENRKLRTDSSHFDFIKDFLQGIDSNSEPVDIAEDFAVRWQKFYQTGAVCVYLKPRGDLRRLRAAVVESLSERTVVDLDAPEDSAVIPKAISSDFAIVNAGEHIGWLFEQLDVEFDLSQTRLAPLLCEGQAVGAIVFEVRYPGDIDLFEDHFKTVTSAAGAVLGMASISQRRQAYAELFARAVSNQGGDGNGVGRDDSLSALAELAAGAAHELNNPLSVISGRAQLLADAETDPEKERLLKQIRENSGELTAIIDDLMAFARPQQPRPGKTRVRQMLDEAIQLTAQKTKTEHINAQIEVAEDLGEVFVDSGQIVSAISNVLCNCVESYENQVGPVKISAGAGVGGSVKVEISDLGCGMEAQTVRKATAPFFSGKTAGRKRGMGLAHAARVIGLNKGRLGITSEPGRGTKVTIMLPMGV